MDSLAQCHLWQLWETSPDVNSVLADSASTLWLKSSQAKGTPLASGGNTPLRSGSLAIAVGAILLGSGLGKPAPAIALECKLETPTVSNGPVWGSPRSVVTPQGYALNVRWGPGTNNGIQRCVLRGSTLQVSGARRNGWVQLIDQTWVAGNWVNSKSPVDLPITPTCNAGNLATVLIQQNAALPIRPGPGLNFPMVAQFADGACIELTGRFYVGWAQLTDGHWVDSRRIQYNGPITNITQPPLDDIVGLQRQLRQAGFLSANVVPSSIYDQATQAAVREFQRVNRLPVTGTIDPATWNSLIPPVEEVKEWQRLLRQAGFLPADFVLSGIYDEATESAVRRFQRVNGLPETGIVDEATRQALNGAVIRPPVSRQMRVNTGNGEQSPVYSGPGPGTESSFVRNIPDGSIVTIVGEPRNGWSELSGGGWVFTAWLDEM